MVKSLSAINLEINVLHNRHEQQSKSLHLSPGPTSS